MSQQAVLVQSAEPRRPNSSVVPAGRTPKASASAIANASEKKDPLTNLSSAGRHPFPGPRLADAPHQQVFDQQESGPQRLDRLQVRPCYTLTATRLLGSCDPHGAIWNLIGLH